MPADDTIRWLLAGDPAIRWQVLRDLAGATERTVERERRKVARDGWGAPAAPGPKGFIPQSGPPRPTLCCFSATGSETCVTGMILSILSYFEVDDDRLDAITDHLLEQQMPDGGWNCRRPRGATHASMHTTISMLEGLRWYEMHRRRKLAAVRAAQRRGREFLLVHRLFRSHRTGAIIQPAFVRFSFPPRWHYDVLRALDYFQTVKAPRDERLPEAIQLVGDKQRQDGRWPLENRHKGKTWFELERPGAPSRWNTLRAMRVLKWWK